MLLDLLLENILAVKRDVLAIIIDIEESQTEYCFDFKSDETTMLNPVELTNDSSMAMRMKTVINLISELNGIFCPIITAGHIYKLTVTIKKAKK